MTLRFLCRIHEEELLEPLVPSGKAAPAWQRAEHGMWVHGARSVELSVRSCSTRQLGAAHILAAALLLGPPFLSSCAPLAWPPAVISNLEHRHSYVRKNAVLALAAIYRLPKGELLVPDAPELVERMLQNEQVGGGGRHPGQVWKTRFSAAAAGGCEC